VHRGALDDLDSLGRGAAAADGVIHLAYNHDFVDIAAAAKTDLRAVEAMGAALVGSGKPFVVTSGTLALALGGAASGPGGFGTEDDVPDAPLRGSRRSTRPSRWPSAACDRRSSAWRPPCTAWAITASSPG
jgi:hypothetical protein